MEQTPPREHQYHSPEPTNHLHSPHIPAAAEPATHPTHHKRELEKVVLPRGLMIIAGLILLGAILNIILNRSFGGKIKLASGLDVLLAGVLFIRYELVRRAAVYCVVAVLVIEIVLGGLLLKDRQSALSANTESMVVTQAYIQKSTSSAERQYYTKVYSELTNINKKLSSSYMRALSTIAAVIGIKLIALFYLARLRTKTSHWSQD